MTDRVIVKLSEEDRKANHVPGWVFDLSHTENVYYEDFKTGELVQVLDLSPLVGKLEVEERG